MTRVWWLGAISLFCCSACGGASGGSMTAGGASGGSSDPPPATGGAGPSYVRLSETGLYTDIGAQALSPDLIAFQPTHFLWSDASEKRRWVRLPAGTQIDTTDIDHWQIPVGTQVFKEFSLGGVLLETRLIERFGPEPQDYWMGSFVWAADRSDAIYAPNGAQNVVGTGHDVPSSVACQECHFGEPGRLLGFTAVQLSGDRDGATLASLAAMGALSAPPAAGESFPVPGDASTAAALGYLHANCGHCHNPGGRGFLFSDLDLRISTTMRAPEATGALRTAVGQPLTTASVPGIVFRIRPGVPEESAIWQLMNTRGAGLQMPPIASELVDPAGLDIVANWIRTLD